MQCHTLPHTRIHTRTRLRAAERQKCATASYKPRATSSTRRISRGRSKRYRIPKKAKSKRTPPTSLEDEAANALASITPTGMTGNEAGRDLFSGVAANELRSTTGVALEPVAPTDPDELEAEAVSFGLAVQTLDSVIGEDWRDHDFTGRCGADRL